MDGYVKRILVVEEDPSCRALLEVQLELEAYAVYAACDCMAGTDEMRKRHFDDAIADGHMPGFGFSFSKGSRSGVHHGCWVHLLMGDDRVVGVEYRSVPWSVDATDHCEEMFRTCVQ